MNMISGTCRSLCLLVGIFFLQVSWAADVDGGFVTQSQGDVTYQTDGKGKAQSLPPFTRLQPGARIKMDEQAKLQLIYFRNGRQESWAGKADIAVGEEESKSSVTPIVKVIPPAIVMTLSKSPDVMNNINTRQGMIRVRSMMTAAKVKEAEDRYGEMRAEAAEDDITPELYLLTTLDGLKAYQSMKKPMAEMLRRQPGNAQAKQLHDHFMQVMSAGAVETPPAEPASK